MIRLFLFVCLLIGSRPAVSINVTDLDCRMRELAFRYAQKIQPFRSVEIFQQIHDALQLSASCQLRNRPSDERGTIRSGGVGGGGSAADTHLLTLSSICENRQCIFVNPNATTASSSASRRTTSSQKYGSIDFPVKTVDDALVACRSSRRKRCVVIFRHGIHTLHHTIQLDHRDNGLSLIGYPGEDVWLSGGMPLGNIPWMPYSPNDKKLNNKRSKIYVANLTDLFLSNDGGQDGVLPKVASLFSTQERFTRARYPNSNPETAQWGYASPDRLDYSLPVQDQEGDIVLEWHRPPPGKIPTFDYVDFRQAGTDKNGKPRPIKNDSTMDGYNLYASGRGGVCADLWGDAAQSYWCSNASAGGWAEVDQECATTGQLQIPVSMTYNVSHPIGRRLQSWSGGPGGYIFAWHSQSWAMHMFEIAASPPGMLIFENGGGRQGGRNWCRCDQCTYAGPWCGQHHGNDDDRRLISGTWLIENVLDELDVPGEFYFDHSSKLLYLYPNTTTALPPLDLRFAMLETLVSIKGAQNIAIENLGFRDASATFFGDWSAPSGGDWSLHRGGCIFLEGVERVRIRDCIFRRLDGNAIFLSGKTSHVSIQRNIFEWIGENAIATWGDTEGWDATMRTQPMNTLVENNVFRELGIFQKQSSAWGQAKAALSTIRYNIMFNMPRAAINFNDMMGGGDVVMHNLIFNTCRESGDHGPINTWDRQPYLTTLKYGSKASFTPLVRTVGRNFIFANYGASEGLDNDDGSSWYHVHHNVFYDSEGFKMDYGGHDSVFEDNLVVSYPANYGQHCVGFGSFYPGHGHIVRRNKCIVPVDGTPLAYLDGCISKPERLESNVYFAPNGTTFFECGDVPGIFTLENMQMMFGLELGSKELQTPPLDSITTWSKDILWLVSETEFEIHW